MVACHAPSAQRREGFGKAHPDLPLAADLGVVLADPAVDGVILLTPPMTHADLVAKCAAAAKHVLLEKPLDVTVERAQQSVELMERAGLRFGVVLQHRFREASQEARGHPEKRRTGRADLGVRIHPLVASARILRPAGPRHEGARWRRRAADPGHSHARPVSEPRRTDHPRRRDGQDLAAAQHRHRGHRLRGAVEFANGAIGTIDATTVSFPGFPEKIELACAKGTAVLEAKSLSVYHQDGRIDRHEGAESKSGGADPMAFSHEAHKGLITNFLDAIELKRDPMVSGQEALKVQVLIEGLLASSESGNAVSLA